MGRSRAVTQPADEDLGQRSKRKRTTSNADNSEAASACHGGAEGKKALYHCNYCNKDISGKIRIKCAACSDFDLCVECFSIGAEVHPHKSNHPYRVMDNLSFPLICPDWNADDEMLLLEGIEMYGLGNWAEVAEHVGTKSKSMCIDHYKTDYMNSTCFPLPDMSRVMGKNREELLAMAREHGEIKKEGDVKEELSFSARFKAEDQKNNSLVVRSSSHIAPDSHADRSVGEKKLRISADESPMVITEISGYDPKRQEFEIEYDNGAETLLAEMEFKETDSEAEHELKMRVLRIYCKRLNERKRRKNFILERNLLNPDLFEKGLSQEEKNICNNYRVFMRFHSKEEHEALLRSLIEEHRLMKRIQYLQEASTAGCLTSSDVEKYIKLKVKMEGEEMSCRPQVSSSGKYLQRANHLKGGGDIDNNSPRGASAAIRGAMILDSGPLLVSSSPSSAPPCGVAPDVWDVSEFSGAELLSDTEIRLCGEMRILPNHYLYMLETMAIGILSGNITKKSDAYRFLNVDSTKVDKVYDMLEHKGIFPKP